MSEAVAPVEAFCSYAHEDETWLRKLEKHLSGFKRQGLISLWYDRLIAPGNDCTKVIGTHREITSIILLCKAVRTVRIQKNVVMFPSHLRRIVDQA